MEPGSVSVGSVRLVSAQVWEPVVKPVTRTAITSGGSQVQRMPRASPKEPKRSTSSFRRSSRPVTMSIRPPRILSRTALIRLNKPLKAEPSSSPSLSQRVLSSLSPGGAGVLDPGGPVPSVSLYSSPQREQR